jgi:SAM-dependent methyltransferase
MRALLEHPGVYSAFRWLVGRDTSRSVYAREHLRLEPGQRVLDLGCGPGDILEFLPPVQYIGYDISQEYIDRARSRFGHRGEFHCRAVEDDLPLIAGFDVVIAHGLLHHLNDGDAAKLFRVARRALKRGGRLVTFDGCYVAGQGVLARLLLSLDRGQYVRDSASYLALARAEFESVSVSVRHDLLRLPYTHIIMECTA